MQTAVLETMREKAPSWADVASIDKELSERR